MLAQWDSPRPGFNFRPWRSISRDFSLADRVCCLTQFREYHKSGVAPLEKTLQSHEDHEMRTDQPGLQRTKKNQARIQT